MLKRPKIVILGAGMSGIACALQLHKNFNVKVFEKSRGVGGRLCAKTLANGLFHFGAQFCKAKSSSFEAFIKQNDAISFQGSLFDCNKGLVTDSTKYFVCKDGMHGLLRKYQQLLNIYFNQKVIKVDETKKLIWFDSGNCEPYDILISSLPLPQSQEIFDTQIKHDATFSSCVAVGMTLNGTLDNRHSAYQNVNEDVSMISSSSFYKISEKETWVLQFSPNASYEHIHESDSYIQTQAEKSIKQIIKGKYEILHAGIFKWKYALCSRSNLSNRFTIISEDAFAIGDWNISPRIESAYISGNSLGRYLIEAKT